MALTYKDAGVDISRGNELINRIKPLAARTRRPEVRAGIGGFGALFALPVQNYREPLLVSGTDGVGTKLRLAIDTGRLDGVGTDLVAMCVNDILTLGAEPLFFLDYYATGRLDETQAERVIAGIAAGCERAGAALIGGETAEMPDMYADGDLDLAGFCVGIVDADDVVDGSTVRAGDAIIGLAANGVHSNGYSLVRHVIAAEPGALECDCDGVPLLDVLMRPTEIYVPSVRALMATVTVKAMAHITGGGLLENVARSLPAELGVELHRSDWREPEVFQWLARTGGIERQEMDRTFNCGIGYTVCVASESVEVALTALRSAGTTCTHIGNVIEPAGDARVTYV
jgi:phosphoribosylformylglycinamidine cyclo-ligase